MTWNEITSTWDATTGTWDNPGGEESGVPSPTSIEIVATYDTDILITATY